MATEIKSLRYQFDYILQHTYVCIRGVRKLYVRLSLATHFSQLNFSINVQLLRCTFNFGRHSRNELLS